MTIAHNFSTLSPDSILNALGSVGLQTDGRLLALNSYENRVYLIGLENGAVGIENPTSVVAKFYRPDRWTDTAILEEHSFLQELVEHEIPVVSPLAFDRKTLLEFEGFRFAVFPKHGGRAPELEDRKTLEWMGRFLGRIHAIGALKPFQHRPTLSIESFGIAPKDYLLTHHFIPSDLDTSYRSVVEHALNGVRDCFNRADIISNIRLHGDCHAGNVLWTDEGPHFVDFDDSRMGPAIQDLWMLLSGERADMARQMSDVLAGYEDFFDFNPNELHLIEALRTLRLIHYAGWLAQRWEDPAFKQAFPWFNTQRYWQDRILELREQIALMQEPSLWSA